MSNWEGDLTENQRKYAALDAIASLLIYQKLNSMGPVGETVTHDALNGQYVSIHLNPQASFAVRFGKIDDWDARKKNLFQVNILSIVSSKFKVPSYMKPMQSVTQLKSEGLAEFDISRLKIALREDIHEPLSAGTETSKDTISHLNDNRTRNLIDSGLVSDLTAFLTAQ